MIYVCNVTYCNVQVEGRDILFDMISKPGETESMKNTTTGEKQVVYCNVKYAYPRSSCYSWYM